MIYETVLDDAELIQGDVNANGTVEVADAILLTKWIYGADVKINAENSEVTSDDKLNVFDLVALKRILLK